MIVLGIESSCDETAAALVDDDRRVLADTLHSQIDDHAPYGGIVPEIAARAHVEIIDQVIDRTMRAAGIGFDALDGIAATGGPGLIGGVIVGVMAGKGIAAASGAPFVAVNHLEGHALTARLTDNVDFPYLLLLVSGGHCQLLMVEAVGRYTRLGTTLDDAAGEAFDKTAKLLGLGYPGGPAVERAAKGGDSARFSLPRPMKGRDGCDFSFSGLKTAVRTAVDKLEGPPGEQDVRDIAASFEAALTEAIVDRCQGAINAMRFRWPLATTLVVTGGVAANGPLRQALQSLAASENMSFVAPPVPLCTDNGVMIAWAGLERLRLGMTDGLDFKPRPRWPLDPDA